MRRSRAAFPGEAKGSFTERAVGELTIAAALEMIGEPALTKTATAGRRATI